MYIRLTSSPPIKSRAQPFLWEPSLTVSHALDETVPNKASVTGDLDGSAVYPNFTFRCF